MCFFCRFGGKRGKMVALLREMVVVGKFMVDNELRASGR